MISGGGWPIAGGAWLVPAGTIIDSTTWTGPTQMPMNAIALDTTAAQQMLVWFNQDYGRLWPQIIFDASVNRAAVFATVTAQMNWAFPTPPPG
jgi:hypothetical protein